MSVARAVATDANKTVRTTAAANALVRRPGPRTGRGSLMLMSIAPSMQQIEKARSWGWPRVRGEPPEPPEEEADRHRRPRCAARAARPPHSQPLPASRLARREDTRARDDGQGFLRRRRRHLCSPCSPQSACHPQRPHYPKSQACRRDSAAILSSRDPSAVHARRPGGPMIRGSQDRTLRRWATTAAPMGGSPSSPPLADPPGDHRRDRGRRGAPPSRTGRLG